MDMFQCENRHDPGRGQEPTVYRQRGSSGLRELHVLPAGRRRGQRLSTRPQR